MKIEIAAIFIYCGSIRILDLVPAFVEFVELPGINLTQFGRRFFAFKALLAKLLEECFGSVAVTSKPDEASRLE